MAMTRQQYKQLSELLQGFYHIDPEQMDTYNQMQWHPFLASLSNDQDRAFALTAYFNLASHNFSQLLIHLGQLSDVELAAFRPALEGFLDVQKAFEARR
jgi:hypothetical protein